MKISLRTDGTAVVMDSPYGPYHVVSKDIDPYNKYDLAEVLDYAQAHPEDVVQEPSNEPTFEELQSMALTQAESIKDTALGKGFMYGTDRIQADPVAQQNATGFLTAISSGVPVPFPIEWRTKANTSVFIQDLDEFKTFAAMMLQFVQTVFHDVWQTKDSIREATTEEQVNDILSAFRGRYEV